MSTVLVADMEKQPRRDDKTVKLARDLHQKAKFIADTLEITVAEYISNLLRPFIEKDWHKAIKKVEGQSQDN